MPVDMYGDVILTRDVSERGLRAGDIGTDRGALWNVDSGGISTIDSKW